MQSKLAMLTKTRTLIKTLNPHKTSLKSISTFTFLNQEPQLAESPSDFQPQQASPLPPNLASGSPRYNENWRTQNPNNGSLAQGLIPIGLLSRASAPRFEALSQTLDGGSLMDVFADWTASQKWDDMKQLFESWIKSLDKHGKPNRPDIDLYNHYVRANLMLGASLVELMDMLDQMKEFGIEPNTASYNLVLRAMHDAGETEAAEKLLRRMLHVGKESAPDDQSYALVIDMLFQKNDVDSALNYINSTLKSGNTLTPNLFSTCVWSCINRLRFDALVPIIEKCQSMDQNKNLCPNWTLCNHLADAAIQRNHSKLAFFSLAFMARWIGAAEQSQSANLLSVDEGLIIGALGVAGRTYSSNLLSTSWAVLKRSLHHGIVPGPETYLAKIHAHVSLGDLQRALGTLKELEATHANSSDGADGDLLSPFTSLYPLVVACSKKGFETLDLVYYQLENLSRMDPPYKSVAALNCVILGCANTWDLDRAYQTFEAISSSIGLTPNIHSYNALMSAFGKFKKTFEATRVFDHLVSLNVKPNATSYSLLVEAHLINRDPNSALSVVDKMVEAGFTPSRDTLKKIKRRCIRELDYESNDRVESIAQASKIKMGPESRRDILFNLQYATEVA